MGDLELANIMTAPLSMLVYLAAAVLAGSSIFGGRNVRREQKAGWKMNRANEAFGAFWTMLVPTAIIAFATFTLPTVQNWYQQQEPPQSCNTAAPEQNPDKMKCGGWRTPPIR